MPSTGHRHRAFAATAIALLLATAGACSGDGGGGAGSAGGVGADAPPSGEPPPEQGEAPARTVERAIFDMVNRERQARDLEPLAWDDRLAELAREWSQEMASNDDLEHQDLDALSERVEGYVGLGENIFQASAAVPAGEIHVGWMRSPGHRANVLRPGFDRLGVGVLCADDGQVWATQRFGATDGAAPSSLDGGEPPPREPIVVDRETGPSC